MTPDEISRYFYRLAYGYIRMFEGRWTRDAALQFRAIPQRYRRAAAHSYNMRDHEPFYWPHDNARAKYDPDWLPF